jgi:LemA protein
MQNSYLLIGAIVIIGFFLVAQYNKLVRLNVTVDEAFGQIEVQLQRRADLIPNLIETVKGYAAHEKTTLESVTNARTQSVQAQSFEQVAAADNSLTSALRGLLAISESYPDLKASENFRALQEELSSTENKIGFARQYYNDNVSSLNQSVISIPGKFFAGPAKVAARDFYVVNDPANREVPKVQF